MIRRRYVESTHYLENQEVIPSERVDSWKHEDRPSLGCESPLSSRILLCWYYDRILYFETGQFSWVRIVNGINKYVTEISEEISTWKRWAQMLQENLSRRLNHDQSLLEHCLLFPFLLRERKWIDINPERFQWILFWQCQKLWPNYCDKID